MGDVVMKTNVKNIVSAILCEVNRFPVVTEVEIHKGVESVLGKDYSGFVLDDDVVILYNSDNSGRVNRAVFSEKGDLLEIIRGDFLLCYFPLRKTFENMPENIKNKYIEKYMYPVRIKMCSDNGYSIIPYPPICKE